MASRIQLKIHAEGEKTESQYLTRWNRLYRENAIISIATHEHTTPFELVKSAAAQRRQDLRNAGTGSEFDQYWCIFDVDEHPKLPEALNMAQANNIKIALSSPCLELWFLLHFGNQTASIERHPAQKRSEHYLKCSKDLTEAALDLLVENFATAKSRAQALAMKHDADGSRRPWNPHSEVWKLVDVIMTGTLEP
jgi:RloB-like protein